MSSHSGPLERVQLPQLQVALDMDADIEAICEVARLAYEGDARIIETGVVRANSWGNQAELQARIKAGDEKS